jgi:hypothetical protein
MMHLLSQVGLTRAEVQAAMWRPETPYRRKYTPTPPLESPAVQRALELLRAGQSYRAAAEATGIELYTLYRKLSPIVGPRSRKGMTPAQVLPGIELLRQGLSYREAAARTGLKPGVLYYHGVQVIGRRFA